VRETHDAGEFVEFTAAADANARASLQSADATDGSGTAASLDLTINGKSVATLSLTSHYSWLYGTTRSSTGPKKASRGISTTSFA